ncbi:hypothetical protein D8674_037430 [Pyrus ussuriensis x Pyrus communis]|uniref:Uncharacterized protein n=1 Tax=Pyrus ussuriensis x Pyrus communis TaxID=2448454 RepID=A0A5N5H9N7_9ROSA|nr:hypothetical protein D8674_037430 [Pyrus ussuriensis x Pyrus communis]
MQSQRQCECKDTCNSDITVCHHSGSSSQTAMCPQRQQRVLILAGNGVSLKEVACPCFTVALKLVVIAALQQHHNLYSQLVVIVARPCRHQ